MRMHNPPHPGLVLREYLGEMAVSAAAAHLRVTRVTLSRVLNGKAGISANMALRLGRCSGDVAGTLDQHAVSIRPLARQARQATCCAQVPACDEDGSWGSELDGVGPDVLVWAGEQSSSLRTASAGQVRTSFGFAQDKLRHYACISIPQRLPRLQRVLNPLLRLPLAAQRLECLALQVQKVLFADRSART